MDWMQESVNALMDKNKKGLVKFHHTASGRGYVSRKTNGYSDSYQGRFGKGFVHIRPRWDTNRFHYVDYYIFTEEEKS